MTYSIVARDPDTGQLGVAAQSCYFALGAVLPWAQAGVGAVATQSMVDPGYGPRPISTLSSIGMSLRRLRSASDADAAPAGPPVWSNCSYSIASVTTRSYWTVRSGNSTASVFRSVCFWIAIRI